MNSRPPSIKHAIFALYDRCIDVIVIGLVLAMLLLLLLSFLDVVLNLKTMLTDAFGGAGGEGEFRRLVGNVLDVFVVVELFATFMGYVRTRHVRLSTLLDVTIVFALRELLIRLYDHQPAAQMLLVLVAVIAVLVGCRTLAARFPPHGGHTDS